MSVATSLWYDEPLEQRIRTFWSEFARSGVSDQMHRGGYRPHLTMGVWDGVDAGVLGTAFANALANERALQLRFDAIGAFNGSEGVVYLTPGVTDELLRLRRRIRALATDLGGTPAPWLPDGPWFPHCTLASRLAPTALRQALHLAVGIQLPLSGFAIAVGIVDTPAEVERHRIALRT